MTSRPTLIVKRRLCRIDDLTRPDHSWLRPEDNCVYLSEYTKRAGYQASDVNQVIFNLKKSLSQRGKPGYHYKAQAISETARWISGAVSRDSLATSTFVPIPPSKSRDHTEYDDRLVQILRQVATISSIPDLDIREIVTQTESTEAAHMSADVPRDPQHYAKLYQVNPDLFDGVRDRIVVFDDVLTTGAHFRAMTDVLAPHLAGRAFVGLFIARAIDAVQ